jgi:hypothetical protein
MGPKSSLDEEKVSASVETCEKNGIMQDLDKNEM